MNYTKIGDGKAPITLLLKGGSGSGKTWKAAHFPRPCIFDFDNNLSGLRKLPKEVRDGIKVINPRLDEKGNELKGLQIWNNFVKLLTEVMQDPEVDTIVVDSLTTLVNTLMYHIIKSDSPSTKIEIQHWGDLARYLRWLGENLMCAGDLDKHIVMIAHEQIEKGKNDQIQMLTLNIGGNMRNSYTLYFSDCWRCFPKPGSAGGVDYIVRTIPGENYDAKCTLDLPPQFSWEKEKENVIKQLRERLSAPAVPVAEQEKQQTKQVK